MSRLRALQLWCRKALRSASVRGAVDSLIKILATVGRCYMPMNWTIINRLDETGDANAGSASPVSRRPEKRLTPAEESAWRQLSATLQANDG